MEEGVAHLYLISSHITTLKAKIEQSIPKKRKGPSQHDKSLTNFFQKILDAIIKNINFEIVKCIIIASPGFTKDEFGDYLTDSTSNNKHYEVLQKNLSKFVYVHSSNGYKQALQEVLSKPEILSQIKNTKASEDIQMMEKFNEILGKDMDRIIFGIKSVEQGNEKEAIDTLIVTDNFLRKVPPYIRQNITSIMKNVKSTGGSVIKMSSQHLTGEKIDSFGGITAILRYAIPELSEMEAPDLDELEDTNKDQEEIENEDKQAMMLLNDMQSMNLDYDDNEINTNNLGSKMIKEEELYHKENEAEEGEEDEEDDGLGENFGNNKYGKGDKTVFYNKHKGKPSKIEQKERQMFRNTQLRKKSNLDEI
jgi:protein pelota